MRLETHLTQKLVSLSISIVHLLPFRTLLATLLVVCCFECVLFFFLCFIMNLFVTRRSLSSL